MTFRVAAVQYELEDITSFNEFADQVTHYISNEDHVFRQMHNLMQKAFPPCHCKGRRN